MTNLQLAVLFFFQLAFILTACQVVGKIAKRFGQPQVVAEMITGVLLGPSLLGLFFPEVTARIFPAESMKVLFPVSQLGLAIYMFVVGMEFRDAGFGGGIFRGDGSALFAWGGVGVDLSSEQRVVSAADFLVRGDDFSRCLHVHYGVSDAGADHSFQGACRDDDGDRCAWRGGDRRRRGLVFTGAGAGQL
jgi:hypothetical protein